MRTLAQRDWQLIRNAAVNTLPTPDLAYSNGGAISIGEISSSEIVATATITTSAFEANKSPQNIGGALANFANTKIVRSVFKANYAGCTWFRASSQYMLALANSLPA